ncbi:MAG TPA: ribbon-helix-helix protein, CopG family [Cyanobacteria bacterium UBA11369]|nr:ribbon-helix-helix protein, CopG family [Cyanobacteria bacterium UBA11371]HBE37014.1 ribbon-helix-helix protein, CopG family [Cyanobacteria bacterium UBA11368]HBE50295.1 ribbon-helix-helix protein, CopG family [Cyanobacteria bacterium UBA11369]
MPKKKSRLNVSLDDLEREKLEKLAEEAGLSLSRTIAQLIRKAKVKQNMKDS